MLRTAQCGGSWYVDVLEEKIILELNYVLRSQHLTVEITSAGPGCSIGQKNVLICSYVSHGLYWQTEELLQFFLIFRAMHVGSLFSEAQDCSPFTHACFPCVVCGLLLVLNYLFKKAKNPQSFMIQKHSKLNMYWSDTSRRLSANQSV